MKCTIQYVKYVGCLAMWAQLLYGVAPTKAISEQPATNHHLGKKRKRNNKKMIKKHNWNSSICINWCKILELCASNIYNDKMNFHLKYK